MLSSTMFAMALSAASLETPLAAVTRDDDDFPTAHVQVSDLDLSSAAGRKQLDRRIRRAARQVCGEPVIGAFHKFSECIDGAIASASARRARLLSSSESAAAALERPLDQEGLRGSHGPRTAIERAMIPSITGPFSACTLDHFKRGPRAVPAEAVSDRCD